MNKVICINNSNLVSLDFTGYEGFTINKDGAIFDSKGSAIDIVLSENKTCAICKLDDGVTARSFNVAGLMVMAHNIPMITKNGTSLPIGEYTKLNYRIKYEDNNVLNCNIDNLSIINVKDYEVITNANTSGGIAKALSKDTYKDTILTDEEAFSMVYSITKLLYTNGKYPSLKNDIDLEDLVSDLYITFLNRQSFKRFDRSKATKKTFMVTIVNNGIKDFIRTKKDSMYSLDFTMDEGDNNSTTLGDITPDPLNLYEDLLSNEAVMSEINSLDDSSNSFSIGTSPIIGKCKLTKRVVALHLYLGFTAPEIADFFKGCFDNIEAKHVLSVKAKVKEDLFKFRNIIHLVS